MLKAEEIRGPSCLTNAKDDEPLFVLRANDELASSIVRTWAVMYHKHKSEQLGGMTLQQQAKYEEAMALASMMDQWRLKEALRRVHEVATDKEIDNRQRLKMIVALSEQFAPKSSSDNATETGSATGVGTENVSGATEASSTGTPT